MYNDDLIHFSKSENCKDVSTSRNVFPQLSQLGGALEVEAALLWKQRLETAVFTGHWADLVPISGFFPEDPIIK